MLLYHCVMINPVKQKQELNYVHLFLAGYLEFMVIFRVKGERIKTGQLPSFAIKWMASISNSVPGFYCFLIILRHNTS